MDGLTHSVPTSAATANPNIDNEPASHDQTAGRSARCRRTRPVAPSWRGADRFWRSTGAVYCLTENHQSV